MNQALQQELLKIVQDSHTGILNGIEFAKSKAPLLIKEILKYSFYDSLIGLFFGFLFFSIGLIIVLKIYFNEQEISFFGFSSLLFGLFFIGYEVSTLLKIKLAPTLFLLDYIKEFIK